MNKKILAIFAGLIGMASLASATAVNCATNPPIPTGDVTTLGTVACTGSGESFSNFTVTATGAATVGLSSMTYNADTGIVLLTFNPTPSTYPLDIVLGYKITGPINGIDFTVIGTPVSGITFTELACSTQLCNGEGNVLFGNIGNALGTSDSASFATQSSVWIKKDINFNSSLSRLTDFTDSSHVPVPEPMTLSMMGVGLLGLGLMRRRQAGKK
jgi:hypothetical protein